MKRLLSVVVLAFVLAPCAHADSILNINITYVTAFLSPGGGVFFSLIGPGTSISTSDAGMACSDWCSGPIPDLSSAGTSGQVFIGFFQTALVGGINYDPNNDISLCCFFGDFSGSVSGFVGEGETFKLLNLTLPGGGWNLKFDFFPATGGSPAYYQFVSGTFTGGTPPAPVPEPGTLGFMATGLAVLAGVIQRQRSIRH